MVEDSTSSEPWASLFTHCNTSTSKCHIYGSKSSLVAQLVKNLPAMQETRVQFLGKSPGEGNGNTLHYSCLENPMDRGVWWATVHGVERIRHDLATKPPHRLHDSSELIIKVKRWGVDQFLEISAPSPKLVEIILPLISLWNYTACKT